MAGCKIKPEYRQADDRKAKTATDDELVRWIGMQIEKRMRDPQVTASQHRYDMLCRREARRRGLTF